MFDEPIEVLCDSTQDLGFANNFSIQPACCSLEAAFSDAAARLHDGCPRSAIARARFVFRFGYLFGSARESKAGERGRRAEGEGRRQDKANCRSLASLRSQRFICTLDFASFRDVRMAQHNVCRCRRSRFHDEFQSCERWRSQCAWRRSSAVSLPSCALARFDAIEVRQRLCRRFPMSIVASWHAMTVRIFGSDLAGPVMVAHVSIRGRSRSSSRSRSQSARRAAIRGG
jgi:hypothetical protein